MLTRLAKIRNKVASSVVSQKDKHNPYLRTDASCSLNSEFEAVPDITNSNFSKLPKWTGEEEHDKQSESGVLHAEIWFPTEPTANMSVKAVDFSYAESRTPESKASSTTFSVAEEEIHIGAPVLPAYEDAEEQFLEEYEDYFEHLSVDNVRKEQYSKLELQRLAYLAYASSPLFSRFQVEEHMRILLEEGPCLGSASILDDSFANLTSYIISTQERLLQLLNTTKDDYSIIFTTGITDGFRLFGDMYPFQRGSLVLVCRDNQEYVKHVVHAAGRQGARMTMAPVGELDLCMHGPELHRLLRKQGWNTGGTGLFIYPAQSCLSGLRHSLNWIVEAQQNGWQVLLDVSSYLPLGILDLSLYQPDFLAGSFYHMLGYPSGIGFLLIHRKSHSIERLNASNSLKLTASPDQGKSCHVVSEDNSINLLTFSALSFGLEHLETVGLTAIQKRSECLAAWLFRTLKSLKHKSNEGKSLLQVYGSPNSKYRGSIVAFNVIDSTGNILPANLIKRLAAKNNIMVGSGNFGNPGLASLLNKSQERISDINMFNRVYNFSAVQVSLGPVSTFQDVYRLVQFLSRFRDEDYVSSEAMGFIEESMP